MNKITLDDIIDYVGQPTTKQSGEIIFGCPICQDKGRDNLKYNLQKEVLYCFANDEHSKQILSEINKKKYEIKRMENKEIPAYIKNQEQYLYYMELCKSALLGTLTKNWIDEVNSKNMFEQNEYEFYLDLIKSDKPEKARAYLKQQRGINTSTIELTGLGFDFKARKWVIPIFDMNCELVGFEYRLADFKNKKIWREKGTKRCLAIIYGKEKADTLYLVEGFLKGYVLLQYLLEKDITDFKICSCSHGVSSLYNCISEIKFSNFNKIKLMLDADEAGNEATEKILNKYPFFVDVRKFLFETKCKDFDKWYINIYLGNV